MLIRLFLLLLLLGGPAHGQPAVVLAAATGQLTLAGHMAWLEDESATLNAAQAAAATAWQPLPGEPSFGFTRSAIWLRFEATQPRGASRSWRLKVNNALLEDVRVYLRTPAGTWEEQRAGRLIPHHDWPLNARSPTFPLELASGTHQVMLRLASPNALSTGITLWETEQFHIAARDEALVWGAYFGIYALVILFQFFFWRWTRETLSGWYVPYAGLNFLGLFMTMGYPQNLFGWDAAVATPLMGILLCSTLGVGSKFSAVQLELERVMPRFGRWLVGAGATLAAAACLLVLAGQYGKGVAGSQIASIIWMVGLLGLAVHLMLRGHAPAVFFLASFGFFYVGVLIRYLRNLGLLEPNLLNEYSVQAGSLLHMVLMCIFIVYRYNALKIALQIEQKARQEQRDFIAMVTHEYRTPLAIISTSAQQLAANLDAPREKSLRRCANIRDAAQRMSGLFDQYLSAERLEEASQPLRPGRCDPATLIQEVVAEWPAERISLALNELPPEVTCDPAQLAIVLRNLLSNAHRHALPDTTIDVSGEGNAQGGLRLAVTNRGTDIPADELPRLFQKYFRGRAASSSAGAGLGLFLVRRIVDLHGGDIGVTSRGGLTTFAISLPGTLPDYGAERFRRG